MFGYKKKLLFLDYKEWRRERERVSYSNDSHVALKACLESLHVCACDVVKNYRNMEVVFQGWNLRMSPFPSRWPQRRSHQGLFLPPLCSAPAFPCQTHSFSFPPRP